MRYRFVYLLVWWYTVFNIDLVMSLWSVHLTWVPGLTSTSIFPSSNWLLSHMIQMWGTTEPDFSVTYRYIPIIIEKVCLLEWGLSPWPFETKVMFRHIESTLVHTIHKMRVKLILWLLYFLDCIAVFSRAEASFMYNTSRKKSVDIISNQLKRKRQKCFICWG